MKDIYKVSVGDTVFEVKAGETISDAAQRQGLKVRLSCRNGVCWVCEATVDVGSLFDASQGQNIGPGGVVRLCRSITLSDAVLATDSIFQPGNVVAKEFACQVAAIKPLSDDVFSVLLRLPAGTKGDFVAGQYLSINLPDADPAFFSIASQPDSRDIELHVQASPMRESAMTILNHLRESLTVKISLAYGKACLNHPPSGPVILIAAGTGYAQVRSIMEALIAQGFAYPIKLFWGGREKRDLYLLEEAERFANQHANIEFYPVYADIEDNDWSGHHAQLVNAVLSTTADLTAAEIFVSGSPGLVYEALDEFIENGLDEQKFYSDVLEYAPRN
ncbi:MAG: 2Fe-2S iron-sulfur cluster binding domain-containing protein [Hahellaceae bacterium]|nr:2Fe-2S iron-sulfur cluster binding domain-containing protein [Hahellaceae bacterium]MCP5209833.1 2Fe-2S iron-sulfur cluster binding domain-containing protein [Hahellaceae bacterium]